MPGPLTAVHYGLYLLGIIFIFICIGTAVGALSKARTDTKKAQTMGLVGFTFCMLGTVLMGVASFIPA
jgi:uncharacterized membrane protein